MDTLIATKDQSITPGIVQTALEDLGQSMEVGVDGKPAIKTARVAGSPASAGASKGAIAGAVIGSVAGAVLLCALILLVLRRRYAAQRASAAGPAPSTADKPAAEQEKMDDLDGTTPRSVAGPLAEGVMSSSTSSSSLQDQQQQQHDSSSRLQKMVRAPVGLRMSEDDQ